MAQISGLVATTELEALNAVMSAMGQAPFSDLTTAAASTDGAMALSLLRNTAREVQAQGWQFNTEFGLAISPVVTNQAWTDPDGTPQTLAIFKVPTGLASWSLAANSTQAGQIDVSARPSKVYVESALPVLVFYDRMKNRDGFPASERALLYIDAVWYFDFDKLPETARAYIVALACQQAVAEILGDAEKARILDRKVAFTWRSLKREQGDTDTYNIFATGDMWRKIGKRIRVGGFIDERSSP